MMTDKHRLLPEFKEQVTEVIKTFIHQERPFQKTRKEKIADLNRLEPGDHISFYKTDLYYAHHGIVCEARTNYLRVIHYFNTLEHARTALMRGSIYIAAIIESEWPVNIESTSEDIYLHHYDHIPCFSNEETLQRAFSQLGRRGYSLLGNNCEHWARWCRTGEHYSEQIYKLRGLVKEKSATLLIVDPTALLVKDVALVGVRTFGQFLSAVGSGVILTAVESISTFIDIKKKKKEREKGSLSDVALKKYVIRRVTSASTAVVGGTAGTVVGTILIPVPILGATVGGFVGSISGKLIGGVSGIALSKILEVYEKVKASNIKKMSTVPQLMANISPSSELVHSLMMIADDREEEEQVSNIIEHALNSHSSLIYPSLEEFTNNTQNTTAEEYHAVTKLTAELFTDSHSYDYFILTPVPDSNAAEEFAASTDLLLLRWPIGIVKPWESHGEQVMDIDDSNLNQE
ncbi:unnamed protein product [Rotaria socialis]|uniref:LRAT domain-containing protein n=3 Tax=Rotaria socialis TaxID=392032 RepID=A0A820UWT5_9BILA|nr:unnamed protein product [Rotaria socialis]CAF3383491.1 unnamed protein product [Rotaria socialis]CAF4130804.1 unnamed protein product [Rotaria socialis]CAF4202623.1 unnamed protein product [Rotaria socialis]CAF4492064.1 unnamed protein product [Rotaria socialis]